MNYHPYRLQCILGFLPLAYCVSLAMLALQRVALFLVLRVVVSRLSTGS